MGRAAVYSLISLGVQNIVVWNRTPAIAVSLADHYNSCLQTGNIPGLAAENAANTRVRVLRTFESDWPSELRQPTAIICCIPRQAADGTPVNFSLSETWLRSPTGGVVIEVAYSQSVGPLRRQVQDRASAGWIWMDGLDVLPEQAFSQFELFTGRRAPRKLMREEVLKHATGSGTNGVMSSHHVQ